MDQQPPKSKNGNQGQNGSDIDDEHFKLDSDAGDKKASSDKSAKTDTYDPLDFDIDSLSDEVESTKLEGDDAVEASTLPLGFVSEPRRANKKPLERPSQKPHVDKAAEHEAPPLGFIASPRPASSKSGEQPPPLGFVTTPKNAQEPKSKVEEAEVPAPKPEKTKIQREEQTLAETASAAPESIEPQQAPEPELSETAVDEAETQVDQAEAVSAGLDSAGELTPGQMLRNARERRGLSIEDIVDSSRMNAETVLALEEDRDPEQSAWVYVRGFYRRYAKALGIAEEPLLDAHARLHEESKPASQPVADEWAPQEVSTPPSPLPKMIFVMIAGICLGTTIWFVQPKVASYLEEAEIKEKASSAYGDIKTAAANATEKSVAAMGSAAEAVKEQSAELAEVANEQYSKAAEKVKTEASPLIEAARAQRESMQQATGEESAEAASAETTAEAPAEVEDVPATGNEAAAEPQATEPTAAEPTAVEPSAAEPEAQSEPAMLEPETAGPGADVAETEGSAAPAAPAKAVLELNFSRQSWLSVSDGNGLVLFEDMVEGDTSKRFEADPPITLFLGTATAAQAQFNGQPVNIAGQMRSNGTARLLLGE